jgi:uncharacterized peroxidase-related enzyme
MDRLVKKDALMPRIASISPENATGEAKALLDKVAKSMGKAPNLTQVMALRPAVLEGYLGLAGALSKGGLPPRTREALALTVAGRNGCDYCASAHSAISGSLNVGQAEIARHREGHSDDPKLSAILAFATAVTEKRGHVSDADLTAVRAAGLSDADIIEIVAQVALNTFTNLINSVAQTEIDFPVASVRRPLVAA